MSMIQYSMLYLIGWLKIEDLMDFRQFNSKTPGHPEVEIPGVECTTGPLDKDLEWVSVWLMQRRTLIN